MEKKIYIAYGSNLNHAQMAYRCPDAEFIGAGVLSGHTLVFKGGQAGVADIIPAENESVPVAFWRISAADERRLDVYEGFPKLYKKRIVSADFNGEPLPGMVYYMAAEKAVKMPSEYYFNTILDGYLDCGIDSEPLFRFLKNTSEIIYR